MNTIKLNNATYEVFNYSKNTYFNGDSMTSNANCSITTSDMSALKTLAQTPITTIQIYHDNTLIYDLQEAGARIESYNEYLNGDRMDVGVNLVFDN